MRFEHKLTDINTYTYIAYRTMIDILLAQNKTTGENHSEAMLGYSKMNVARMNRLDKKSEINEDLAAAVKNLSAQRWIVISEAWCGDAAQNLPWINKIVDFNENIELSIILRDENLDIMDQFLTSGGRSIPKVIALDSDNEILFSWGPRPRHMQDTYSKLKDNGLDYAEISKTIHTMYAKNKGQALQQEFLELLTK